MARGGAVGSRPVTIVDKATDHWGRRECLITASRLLLSGVALLVLVLAPSDRVGYARIAFAAVLVYTGYAVLAALHAWTADAFTRWWPLSTHVIDLACALVIVGFTDGSTSPFFAFMLFPLLPAALRWQWRGALWTAMAVTVGFLSTALVEVLVVNDPHFALNALILGVVHVAMLAIVLGYMSTYEEQSRRTIVNLATWNVQAALDDEEANTDLLAHVAHTMKAPRVLLCWRASEAKTTTVVDWTADAVKESTEDVASWDTALALRIRNAHFLCARVRGAKPRVLYASPAGLGRWRGKPVGEAFLARFSPRSILSFQLHAEGLVGRVFVLDKRRIAVDDLTLGGLVAQQVEKTLQHRVSLQRLEDAAAIEERARVARDLHDELSQSMTALSLGLETVARLIERTPERAREGLSELQSRLSQDQRSLRMSIHGLKRRTATPPHLARQLPELVAGLERDWGLPVKLDVRLGDITVPDAVAREVRLIVREAIVNVARHADASTVYVTVRGTPDQLSIAVVDDGRGFPFTGRYDDAERRRRGVGPVVLAERVEALGGSLAIASSASGARLDIGIPLG
jgi:signal transduction histidine kinase